MRMMACSAGLLVIAATIVSCGGGPATRTLTDEQLRDKIAGGWAGKMIGVSYGAPTEFRAQGRTYDDSLGWDPGRVANSLQQDDIYVQLSFMMAMDRHGIDVPAEKLAESFATAGYRLWHANVQARKNFFDGIMPPLSGSPEYNLHADDIDFQIESDYIGFMCPGMPQTALRLADRVGHIMNYGDGVYGGYFVAALYTEAFFETDIPKIVNRALLSLPEESDYARCVRDVMELHAKYPEDWRTAWTELEEKWGDVDICGALSPFNIDAKLNGAYIVMGLLYGDGDFGKTLEISTRCGQDSDCNPSNAAAVIGVINGYSGIPEHWKAGIPAIADSHFIFTGYTFNSAVDNTMKYARELIAANGGRTGEGKVTVRLQEPAAPPLEVSFPRLVPMGAVSVFEDSGWTWKGEWNIRTRGGGRGESPEPVAKYAESPDAEVEFVFTGTGAVLKGLWKKDGGKADVYVDGEFHRSIDTWYFWAGEEKWGSFLWHVLDLAPGRHTVRLVPTGTKRPEAEAARVYITGATIFDNGPKKSDVQ